MGFHQFSLALAVMLILLKSNYGGASGMVKSDTTYHCNGLLNDCRIGEDLELELNFLMDSYPFRILQDANSKLSSRALDANLAVQTGCEGPYSNCIAGGKDGCRNLFACRKQLGHNPK